MDVRRVVEYLVVAGIVERKDSEVSISSKCCKGEGRYFRAWPSSLILLLFVKKPDGLFISSAL